MEVEGLEESGRKKVRHASIRAFPGHLMQSICTPTQREKGKKERECKTCGGASLPLSVNLVKEYNCGRNLSPMPFSSLETGVHLI